MTASGPARVALVGYGYWGANLARNVVTAPSLDLIGIADGDRSRLDAALVNHPGIRTWTDLDDALADADVDAVVLAVPAGLHHRLARKVLDAGKHVLVEKPLAMTKADADELVELANAAGVTLMVGHTFLYSPPVAWLRKHIDDGGLGTVQYLYSQRLSLGRIRRDCNALWNFAPHDVSIMVHLLGELPVEVSATSLAVIDPQLADVFFASLQFPSGIGAHLHVSWIDPRKTRLMTIVGDDKMAVYDDVSVDQKVSVVDAGVARGGDFGEYESMGDFQWRTRAGDILIPKIDMVEPLRAELEAFGQACVTGESPLSDGRHGADVVAILEAIDTSAVRRGVPVELEW